MRRSLYLLLDRRRAGFYSCTSSDHNASACFAKANAQVGDVGDDFGPCWGSTISRPVFLPSSRDKHPIVLATSDFISVSTWVTSRLSDLIQPKMTDCRQHGSQVRRKTDSIGDRAGVSLTSSAGYHVCHPIDHRTSGRPLDSVKRTARCGDAVGSGRASSCSSLLFLVTMMPLPRIPT